VKQISESIKDVRIGKKSVDLEVVKWEEDESDDIASIANDL
jgi:hypothetical protein